MIGGVAFLLGGLAFFVDFVAFVAGFFADLGFFIIFSFFKICYKNNNPLSRSDWAV